MEDWEHARRCFVLKPFSVRDEDLPKYGDRNHWTEVYGGLIRPAVEGCGGLVCERDDIDVGSRAIVEGIFTKIEHADWSYVTSPVSTRTFSSNLGGPSDPTNRTC